METFILVVHVLIAIIMVILILLQQGKGADAGASFGAGTSGTVFGGAGAAGFLTKFTTVLALLFFITSLALAVFARQAADNPFGLPAEEAVAAPQDLPELPSGSTVPPAPVQPDLPTVPSN